MISFMNDYSEGAHPRILDMLAQANYEQNEGYGKDMHSEQAREYIRKLIGRDDVDIHFLAGGTQTNLLVISSFLRPHQCVVAAETGHINVRETGAIEATGHKVVVAAGQQGKLTPEAIEAVLAYHRDEHMVQPKIVYLSNSTELGTVYTKAELTAIRELCQEKGLLLFLDGARLACALTCKANDLTLSEIARLVDVFYLGGTKNGALFGEALVICKKELKEDFRYLIKQRGALLAKGFVLGIQFEALFQDDLYFELARHANDMADQIATTLRNCGYAFYVPPQTNLLFPILPAPVLNKMSQQFRFSIQKQIDEQHYAVRLVTSWATTQDSVNELRRFLESYRP